MKRLQGKVAVVTGGNSGIGLASAQRLKEEGAKVAITGRSQKTLDEAVKLLGTDILAIQSDVSKSGEIEKVYEAVSKKFGKIDILFANAGVAKFLPVAAVTEAHYDEQFDINSKGAYFTIQKALPYLNDGASIILNTSVVSQQGLPTGSVYAATKAAMRSLTRSFASALVERNIRVNAVAPGPIETPISGELGFQGRDGGICQLCPGQGSDEALREVRRSRLGCGLPGFLDASYITGVELNVDGGMGQI